MKPTSVIFLIVAVLLFCVGLLLCMTATNMATEQGIGIFSQIGDDESDNYTTTEYFEIEDLKKIVVKVSDVKINVLGGREENKVELVNFTNGSYQYQLNRSSMQIEDNVGITGIIDVENFKINFNGFRDYLHYFEYKDKPREINIYLTEDAELVNMVLTTDGGDVNISEMDINCDYKITVGTGHVSLNDVNTDSSIQVESTVTSNIDLISVNANEIRVLGFEAYLSIDDTTFSRAMYINIDSGDVMYDRVESDFAGIDVLIQATGNSITVWGDRYSETFSEMNAPIDDPELPDENDPEQDPPEDEDPDEDPDEDQETTEEVTDETTEEEPDEDVNSSLTVKANTLTIIVGEGNIEIK